MLFPKISALNVHSWYPYNQLSPKIARWNLLKTMPFLLSIHMLNYYGLPFICDKLHFRFHKLSAVDLLYFWISYAKYLSDIQQNVTFPWHIASVGFFRNTNRLPSDNAQEQKILFEIDPLTKCQFILWKSTPVNYISHFNTRYAVPLFSYT